MTDRQILKLIILLGASSIAFYVGYRYGSYQTIEVYGGVMEAEALVYLAAQDAED